jgi:hypothetical protein
MNRQQRRAQVKHLQRSKTTPPRKDRKIMARKEDLSRIEADITAIREEGADAIAQFNSYSADVMESIRTILTAAGILEEIESMEKERMTVRDSLQKKIDSLNTRLSDLLKVKEYMEGLVIPESPVAADVPEEAPVVVETPAVEVEVAPVPVVVEAPVVVEDPAPVAVVATAPVVPVAPVKKPVPPKF